MDLIKKQQRFSSYLFHVGMTDEVTVIPSSGDEIRVRSTGGCFGILSPGYNFPLGTLITATVTSIQKGMPEFTPTEEWLLARTPQKGRVVFFTPRGVVVELKENTYAVYQPAQGLSEELQATLKERQEVEVRGLTKTSEGTYEAQTLNVIPEAEKPQPTDPMAPWSEEKIAKAEDPTAVGYRNDEVVQKAREMGSLWFAGPYKLGFNYRVTIEDGVPTFEDKAYPAFTFNVIIDDRCQQHIADGEEVVCRINHISRQGPTSFTFKVSILKVL